MASYVPHDPSEDVHVQLLREHAEEVIDLMAERDRPLRAHVAAELRGGKICGDREKGGFVVLKCRNCGDTQAVALTCRGRGFCPRCGGRWMASTAAHLMDEVLPQVAYRQWVLVLPMPLRFRLSWDTPLRLKVLNIFQRTVAWLLRRKLGEPQLKVGMIGVEQRFGSSLNLNLHSHMLAADGGWVEAKNGSLVFRNARIVDADVEWVVKRVRRRVERLLEREGLDAELLGMPEEGDGGQQLGLYSSQYHEALGSRAGKYEERVRSRAGDDDGGRDLPRLCAWSGYFNVHAATRVGPRQRDRLERLLHYFLRPPFGRDSLSKLPNGKIALKLHRRYDDGTSHIVFEPQALIGRLAALVPPPKIHRVHYYGVFAPASQDRARVIKRGTKRRRRAQRSALFDLVPPERRYIPFLKLLERTFDIPACCKKCGGRDFYVEKVAMGPAAISYWLSRILEDARQCSLLAQPPTGLPIAC